MSKQNAIHNCIFRVRSFGKETNSYPGKTRRGCGSKTNNVNRYKCNNNTSALVQRPNTQETKHTERIPNTIPPSATHRARRNKKSCSFPSLFTVRQTVYPHKINAHFSFSCVCRLRISGKRKIRYTNGMGDADNVSPLNWIETTHTHTDPLHWTHRCCICCVCVRACVRSRLGVCVLGDRRQEIDNIRWSEGWWWWMQLKSLDAALQQQLLADGV